SAPERILRRSGSGRGDWSRALGSGSAIVQRHCLDISGRGGHRHDRRDRAHTHALLARHHRCRRHRAGGSTRSPRSELNTCMRLRNPRLASRRACRLVVNPMARHTPRTGNMAEEPLTDTPESPEALVSTDQVADLQRERDDYQDRWMRKSAEFDNYRKRIERERRQQADQKVVDLLLELLLVVDDFDRALTVDAADVPSYRKGVELIHTKLQDLLRKHNVKPIDSVGADFDPNLHQAVAHEVSAEHREGEVIGELRRGYMMGDRLLRPAMVRVAKS